MLFGTAAFAFAFLPIVFAGFFLIGRLSHSLAAGWLFLASIFFYAYWLPLFTILLLGSVAVNFIVGASIGRHLRAGAAGRPEARVWLIAGLVFNLGLLGYFKYANFFVDSLDALLGTHWNMGRVTLPIGISFFTFTQIAFLADTYQRGVTEYKFTHYGLFVTYFPHLIAGPVLHHAQMMPQFGDARTYRLDLANVAAGLVIFTIGLLKKIVLADGISPFADAVFNAADRGATPLSSEAWLGALAYTFQLYFDFSGYTDMALGLSLMFNVRMPYNFDSPYKAANIIDFWRRWHMTLSAFLRDYLYITLGGNRKGSVRRYANLLITMLLGGLWHGASWSFVFWGGLHGVYLVINHGYQRVLGAGGQALARNPGYRVMSVMVTFVAVVVAWVYFRAHTFSGANTMLSAMAHPGSFASPGTIHPLLWNEGLSTARGWAWCLALGLMVFLTPNSNRIGAIASSWCRVSSKARFFLLGAAITLSIFLVVLNETRGNVSAFIYFNF
jgi:alginate O-acetyltransferase complex protein AlgI